MDELNIRPLEPGFLQKLWLPVKRLEVLLKQDKGVRIGESSVLSRKMHTFNPAVPEKVYVMQHVDAGQSFYKRSDTGRVCHLDVFHQCGLVDHKLVARAVKKAIEDYNYECSMQDMIYDSGLRGCTADLIDIQTGTGGGRITGSLQFGKKLSLRKAHENHVHVTAMLEFDQLPCLFYIVRSVEDVILASGLEIRCNERIEHMNDMKGDSIDLKPYTDQTDSFLKERNNDNAAPEEKQRQFNQDVNDLMNTFDNVGELKDCLTVLDKGGDRVKLSKHLREIGCDNQALERLAGMGIARLDGKSVEITQYGREFKEYIVSCLPEIEAGLRRMLRSAKPLSVKQGRSRSLAKDYGSGTGRRSLLPVTGHIQGELAVAETIHAAVQRMVVDKESSFSIIGADLKRFLRRKTIKTDICIVVDASASMAGQRIRAAKFLIRHLLLSTQDRIGVVVFQENQAYVQVPLTRDLSKVEQGLSKIVSYGATPLALGLKSCVDYLKASDGRNPMVILISDGVPTLADTTRDPMADAIVAAQDIKTLGYKFICIGLKPYRNYLAQLAQAAGGSAYMLDELEKQVLARVAWMEHA